jgi:hypothetical protein
VERGVWKPSTSRGDDARTVTFSDVAYDWWRFHVEGQKAEATQRAYKAGLDGHIMPFFGKKLVREITRYDVDRL